MQSKLVQSHAGLEHHIHKLPVTFHREFRIHGNKGCSYYDKNKWERAIIEFERCREILKLVMKAEPGSPEIQDACSWLMVWAGLPLANIYVFKRNKFKKAFNLQLEMERMIPGGNSDELRSLKDTLRIARFTTLYQYCVSHVKNLDLKKEVVTDFGGQRSNQDDNAIEVFLLTELFCAYMDNGNFNTALGFIQKAKQYLSKEDADGISKNVELEVMCYMNLGMDDAAQKAINNYSAATRTPLSKLPPRMQRMNDVGFNSRKPFPLHKPGDLNSRRFDNQQRNQKILELILSDNKRQVIPITIFSFISFIFLFTASDYLIV